MSNDLERRVVEVLNSLHDKWFHAHRAMMDEDEFLARHVAAALRATMYAAIEQGDDDNPLLAGLAALENK